MCRKIAVGAVLVVAGLFLLNLTGLSSYTTTAFKNMRAKAKGQVPLEFEIDRIRNQVSQLVPDMKKNCTLIAEEIVAVENLKEEVATIKTNVKDREAALRTATRDVEAGLKTVSYRGQEYPAGKIGDKLSQEFATFKRCEAELKSKQRLLEAKEKALETAREQLATMKSQKQELEVQVAQLEADLKTVRLEQTRTKFHFDDSQLSKCKASLAEIRDRLNVEKKSSELYESFNSDTLTTGEKKVKSPKDVAKEINAHFDAPKDETVVEQK